MTLYLTSQRFVFLMRSIELGSACRFAGFALLNLLGFVLAASVSRYSGRCAAFVFPVGLPYRFSCRCSSAAC